MTPVLKKLTGVTRALLGALNERKSWRPSSVYTAIIQVALCLIGFTRGVDYMVSKSALTPKEFSPIQAVMPLWVWGLLLAIGAFISIAGATLAWCTRMVLGGLMAVIGHLIQASIYIGVGAGILQSVGLRQSLIEPFNDPFISGLAFIIFGVMVHPVLAAGIALQLGIAKGKASSINGG